ncbi:FeoA family protein [uncultured delta proteobacterium]|uniref:FeoA family protein n=1 Tax=uncultured delta proteobacterium TaxID=34034 RepID=A0A212KBJ5_9DELT|nr:FeoA family protein [uncultured delta proteobacterium]
MRMEQSGSTINLRQMRVGQTAVIAAVAAQGELGRRIRDMGIVPGAAVEIVGRAPLKDPVALRLQGFTLTLRNNEADWITVTPRD